MGTLYAIQEATRKLGINLKGARAVVQGYGNAGAFAATLLKGAGAKIIAVSDSKGGIVSERGFDPHAALSHKENRICYRTARNRENYQRGSVGIGM